MANIKKERVELYRLGDYIPIFIASVSLAAIVVSILYLAAKAGTESEKAEPRLVVALGTDSSPDCIMRVTDGPKPIGNTGLAAVRVVRQKYADSLDTALFVSVASPIKIGDLVKAQELHARTGMHQWRSMSTAIPVTPTDRDCD